jgi:hypothetical protein
MDTNTKIYPLYLLKELKGLYNKQLAILKTFL